MIKIECEINIPESKVKDLFKEIVIICDTREKSNQHILDYFNKNGIKYKVQNLDFGDYSYMIPKGEYFHQDLYFTNHMVIERKNSLEELSSNFSSDRSRIENELAGIYDKKLKCYMIIEKGTFSDLMSGNYETDYHKAAFMGTMLSFMGRYDYSPLFTNNSGELIFNLCKYHLRNLIK